jgi:hypothetical protein
VPSKLAAALRKPPIQLSIVPAADSYEVGRPVTVRVVATGLEQATIREARADLVMKVWLRKPQVVAGQWGAARPSTSPQRTVAGASTPLRLAGDLPAGSRAECDVALPNWAQAPSGGRPPGRRIEYAVRAEVKLASGGTVRAETPVRLVSGPALYQKIEGTQRSRHFRRCDIELIAPALHARPGQTLRGTVRVTPHRPMRARSVAAFLIRRQSVPRTRRIMRAGSLARGIQLTGPQEFPFDIPVPDEAPTMITPYLSVHWYVQAVVRYGLFAADRCDWEFNVYTGPAR